MKISKIKYVIAVCFLSIFTVVSAASMPREEIKLTINAVLDTLRDKELSKPEKKEQRRKQLRTLIRDRFDFQEMSKRSLAKHWNKITSDERNEFVAIFGDLLEASYLDKIEAYTDEKITYDKEVIKGEGNYGVVSTSIVKKDVTIPIEYKVIMKKEKWWVYDVVIEGVSFISTYRSQYDKIIMKESYTGLVKKMKTKLDEVNAAL